MMALTENFFCPSLQKKIDRVDRNGKRIFWPWTKKKRISASKMISTSDQNESQRDEGTKRRGKRRQTEQFGDRRERERERGIQMIIDHANEQRKIILRRKKLVGDAIIKDRLSSVQAKKGQVSFHADGPIHFAPSPPRPPPPPPPPPFFVLRPNWAASLAIPMSMHFCRRQ